MEDSYTVHRRRKAAARRREKTPEPSTRSQRLLDASEDEEEATRARMEKMAEDTERLEKEKQPGESRNEERAVEEAKSLDGKRKKEERQVELGKSVVRAIELRGEISRSEESMMDARSAEAASVAADDASRMRDVVGNDENEREETKRKMAVERSPRSIRKAAEATDRPEEESRREMLEIRETLERSAKVRLEDGGKEVGTRVMAATAASVVAATASATTEEERHAKEAPDARKIDRRTKKKSKDRGGGLERLERQSRSTDSSDERSETASPRRTKSSDTSARTRTMRKSASSGVSSRSRSSGNAETAREKRSVQRRDEDAEDRLGVSESARDDESDRGTMTKSQSFPHRSLGLATGMKRSTSDVRKQVIPLSNESLLEDFAKAQRDYLARERGILDPEPTGESLDECVDVFQDAREEVTLRKRKHGEIPASSERQEMTKTAKTGVDDDNSTDARWWKAFSFLGWLLSAMRRSKETKIESDADYRKDVDDEFSVRRLRAAVGASAEQKVSLLDFFRTLRNFVAELKAFTAQNPRETRIIRCLRNRCIAELILVVIYCGLGAFVFRFTEGAFEAFYKCGVKRVKRDFLDSLWNYSHNLREDDWKSVARRKLMEFEEQLHTAHEAGVHTYSGQRSWSFMNAIVYCLTVITTIGYGHISPSTTTGRAITIIYAIFGIPMFLIILADFGKLFTRGIKFLWAFVRRLYYTGSCRKVRRTGPVQEVMKGVQLVYDLATFRRPSQLNPEEIEEMQKQAQQQQVLNLDGNAPDTPGTPAMSTFAIDDEFNLPISVAIFILLGYIFVGATLYYMWEEWSFFESFYFVFISMSTIGFGDYVPKHPIYMMCSIIYLVFGLALTSMCINVVQVMLSDSFKQASQKIGATIGFEIAEDDGSIKPAAPQAIEVADVHASIQESESIEKIAPKAKQEDVDL